MNVKMKFEARGRLVNVDVTGSDLSYMLMDACAQLKKQTSDNEIIYEALTELKYQIIERTDEMLLNDLQDL